MLHGVFSASVGRAPDEAVLEEHRNSSTEHRQATHQPKEAMHVFCGKKNLPYTHAEQILSAAYQALQTTNSLYQILDRPCQCIDGSSPPRRLSLLPLSVYADDCPVLLKQARAARARDTRHTTFAQKTQLLLLLIQATTTTTQTQSLSVHKKTRSLYLVSLSVLEHILLSLQHYEKEHAREEALYLQPFFIHLLSLYSSAKKLALFN